MAWSPTDVQVAPWGRLQVIIGHTDVTFFREAPTQVGQWESTEPFGDATLTISLPQVTPFEPWGEGALSWLFAGAPVDLRVVRPDGSRGDLWLGLVADFNDVVTEDGYRVDVNCVGVLYQADFGLKDPGFFVEARDIGVAIADALNGYRSRDYAPCAAVSTGITTRQRGSWNPVLTGFVQDLLTGAQNEAGGQWTVTHTGRVPRIQVKDRRTVHATLVTGQPGLELNLSQDAAATPNVIYGSGVEPSGCWWGNAKFPNLRLDDAPVYPLAASATFSPGGGTTGFAAYAEELRNAGYDMVSGDTYDSRDAGHVRDVQTRSGVQVDGVVGPQTWASTFQTGSNGGDLSGAWWAPLRADPRVAVRVTNAQGVDLGPNPQFQPDRLRVERYINFGEGVTRDEGAFSANQEMLKSLDPGYFGSLTLRMDPPEQSRFELRAGMNVQLRAHRGASRLFHVSRARVNWQAESVTLEVDTHARDLLTLAAVRQRDRQAANDPARRRSPLNRRSRETRDAVVPFDCASGAGIVPRHALRGGLWTVLRIPFGSLGQIARTEFTADVATEFALGVFGKPVTAADLARLVGNPLAQGAGAGPGAVTSKPWNPEADALREAGLLVAWGSFDQPCGYYPGVKSDLDPVTGRFVDDATWYYDTVLPPWVWVAEYSPVSCFIRGRFFPAVET